MTIGIDISMLNYQGSGVANYTFNLVKNLLKYDKKDDYRLFYSSLRRPKNFYYLKELKKIGADIFELSLPITFLETAWGRLNIIEPELFIGKVDVFVASDYLRPPTFKGTRVVTTVHDLIWKIFPEYHEERIIRAHEKKLAKTIKYNDSIIADSKNTKKDLLKYYPKVKEINVHVIYPGIGEQYKKMSSSKYPGNFVLYAGAVEPRKNLETAIRVFHDLVTFRAKSRKPYADFKFLIAGRGGWKNENILPLIKKLGLKKKIKFMGYVAEKDLPYLYSAAKVFMFLSLYEGFGLPPSEAAACGTPTLLYANSSLKEIFKPGYPYTKKGKELETLKKLIDEKPNVKKFMYDFSWKNYCAEFLKIIAS